MLRLSVASTSIINYSSELLSSSFTSTCSFSFVVDSLFSVVSSTSEDSSLFSSSLATTSKDESPIENPSKSPIVVLNSSSLGS